MAGRVVVIERCGHRAVDHLALIALACDTQGHPHDLRLAGLRCSLRGAGGDRAARQRGIGRCLAPRRCTVRRERVWDITTAPLDGVAARSASRPWSWSWCLHPAPRTR